MATVYTAESLIESIRNLGMVPNAGTLGGNDSDILRHINEEMSLTMIPELLKTREEYLVVTTRQALSSTGQKYRIPNRAIGDRLRAVQYVDENGDKGTGEIPLIPHPHHSEYSWTTSGAPIGYYLEGNYICLIGETFSGSLDLTWYFRPGSLVLSTECRQVATVTPATKTITLTTAPPTAWTTTQKYDIHSEESGAEIKVWGSAITSIGGPTNSVVFSDSIDGTITGTHPVEVGDWICLQKECAILPLPYELQPLIIRAVSVRMAEAQGDADDVRMEHDLLLEAKENCKVLTKDRAGKPYTLKGCKGIIRRM